MADEIDLADAYEIAFTTPAGVQVLRDLISTTGFLASLPIGANSDLMVDHNAMRRTFGRIYEILMATPRGREAVAEAFRPAISNRSDE